MVAVEDRELLDELVRPARAWDQERVYIRPTTKGRRERTVVVSEEMGALLRRWKAQRAEERLAFGPAYVDEGWICAEADGSPIQPDTLSGRFRALERRAGVPHPGLHACRHTHAELALAGGIRLDVVSKQLGHASISITADVYGHSNTEALEEAASEDGDGAWRREESVNETDPRKIERPPSTSGASDARGSFHRGLSAA